MPSRYFSVSCEVAANISGERGVGFAALLVNAWPPELLPARQPRAVSGVQGRGSSPRAIPQSGRSRVGGGTPPLKLH